MRTALLALLAVITVACGGNKTRVAILDGHGDQHLWYEVTRTDEVKEDGSVVPASVVNWAARMTTSLDPNCTAQNFPFYTRCDGTRALIAGQDENLEAAIETINAHFDLFKKNNALVHKDEIQAKQQ